MSVERHEVTGPGYSDLGCAAKQTTAGEVAMATYSKGALAVGMQRAGNRHKDPGVTRHEETTMGVNCWPNWEKR
jgi:hypothetical protein